MTLQYPVIAVVDQEPFAESQETTVIWHVQTAPDVAESSGKLSGAWVVSPKQGDVPVDQLQNLLHNTYHVDAHNPHLESFVAALNDEVSRMKAFQPSLDSGKKSSLTVPRLMVPDAPDLTEIAEAYHGETQGRRAWTVAMALGELISAWHEIERTRRGRKYLREGFGTEIRPFPLPEASTK